MNSIMLIKKCLILEVRLSWWVIVMLRLVVLPLINVIVESDDEELCRWVGLEVLHVVIFRFILL